MHALKKANLMVDTIWKENIWLFMKKNSVNFMEKNC